MVNIGEIATHPLVVLIVGAILSSLIIPKITKRWQDHQKELEIKIELIKKISEIIMKEVMSVQFMKIQIGQMDIDSEEFRKKWESTNEDYRQLEIQAAIIESQLIAYFHNNKDIKQTWKNLKDNLTNFYADLQNIYKNTVLGKVSSDSTWRDKKDKIIAEKDNLIIKILTGRIKGL